MHKINIFLLLLPLGVAACTGTSRTNVLHSLGESASDEGTMVVSSDSIRYLETSGLGKCMTIRIPNVDNDACLDTVFSSYTFIPLQTTEESVIGQITKIIRCSDCYCILDRNNSNVLLFELDGRFRCRLGEKGHGPGEHIDAWNVAYDDASDEIVLLDLSGRKLMHYDPAGDLKRVEKMFYLYTDLEYHQDCMVLNTGTSSNTFSDILDLNQLVVARRDQSPIACGFKASEQLRRKFAFGTRLKRCDGEVVYDDLLSDTLWSIAGYTRYPLAAVCFDKGPHFDQDEKKNMTDKLFRERGDKVGLVINWHISSHYISLLVRTPETGHRLFNVLYSRKSGRSKVFGSNVDKSRFGDHVAMAAFDGVDACDRFIRVVEPLSIKMYLKDMKIVETMSAQERELADAILPDDNPVLMVMQPVDF